MPAFCFQVGIFFTVAMICNLEWVPAVPVDDPAHSCPVHDLCSRTFHCRQVPLAADPGFQE